MEGGAENKFSDYTSDWSMSGKQIGPAQLVGLLHDVSTQEMLS